MSIKGLLFDFNGTLFFDSECHIQAFNKCFELYGIEPLERSFIINNFFGKTNELICKGYYVKDATAEDVAKFDRVKEGAYIEKCLALPNRLCLCRGAADMLDYLKENNIPYCIATGSPIQNIEFYFEHLGLGKWFDSSNLVYADGSFKSKPAPDCYQIAAQRLGLTPNECAIFEDGTSGILAANAAGADKVIALWEDGIPSPLTDSTHVDEIHHDLSDWKGILSRLEII